MKKSTEQLSSSSMTKIRNGISPIALLGAAALAAVSMPAFAHPGHSTYGGLLAGFVHPLSGFDHLLAMIAVGVWAAQLGGRAMWAVPLAFVSMMALGAVLAMTGVIGMAPSAIEPGIAASLLGLGLLVVRAQRLPMGMAAMLVGVFALFHGVAHAAELPGFANPMRYAFGFLAATILLHGIGLGFGATASARAPLLSRLGGAATAVAGAIALVGSV